MPTLDLWSNAANVQLRSLFRSALATLLLLEQRSRPIYLCSPWISDFVLFDNRFRQFDELVPAAGGSSRVRLSDCLRQLARLHAVRVVSRDTEATRGFLASAQLSQSSVEVKLADDALHEKGLLTPIFYFEGSMNITYSGVHINTEKVAYHAGDERAVIERIAKAYLELDRRWVQLGK